MRPVPDFVIIGAMRSGTTSLFRYLDAHPEVCAAGVKEVHFFDRNFERGVDWYAGHFTPEPGHRVVGEATPNYLFDPDVPARMWEVLPESKLVAILRNPVDRAYSHYWQKRSYGTEPLDFEEAIAAEAERIAQDERAQALYSYVARGRYHEQLMRYLEYYPRTSLGVFLFEDLSDEPVETFRRICSFIGVSDDVAPDVLGRGLNAYQEFRFPWLRSAARSLPAPLRKLVGKVNASAASYPEMAPATRKRLVEAFEDQTRALEEWSGWDLSSWRR